MLEKLLKIYRPHDNTEAAIAKQLAQFLAMTDNAYGRDNLVAHVVADAWIVNPARTRVVMVEHKLDQVWGSPGGHCDGNPDVMLGAIREAEEEAGITNLKPLLGGGIFDLATGQVPFRMKEWGAEPAHLHFDVCFAFEAPDATVLKISDESTGLAWVNLKDIAQYNYRPAHLRRIEKTLSGLLNKEAA